MAVVARSANVMTAVSARQACQVTTAGSSAEAALVSTGARCAVEAAFRALIPIIIMEVKWGASNVNSAVAVGERC